MDNPGQYLVDLYIHVSTTDVEAIVTIAKKHQINAILGYASDPATYTAAVVSNILNLPGNSQHSIELLTHKGSFRNLQQNIGIPVPPFLLFSSKDILSGWKPDLPFPYIIKPVDSSDTKGVFYIKDNRDFKEKALESLRYTRCDTLIAEAFVHSEICNLHGDGFVLNGTLIFMALGKLMYYSNSTNLKPSATWYPGDVDSQWHLEAERQINIIIKAAGFENGPINIEARADASGKLYIMEVGPRSGGGMTPQTITHAYGFDMLKATFDWLEGNEINLYTHHPRHTMLVTVHVNKTGQIVEISEHQDLVPFLIEAHLYVKTGDFVKSYDQPGSSLGAYIYQFENDFLLKYKANELYDKIIDQITIRDL